jgi:hypothetical protein
MDFFNNMKPKLRKDPNMKKLTFYHSIVFLLVVFSIAYSQPRLGIIGGLNVSDLKISVETVRDANSIKNFGCGGILEFKLFDNLLLSLQPMYIQKGAIVQSSEFQPQMEWNMEVLEIPVLLKLDFGDQIRPYFLLGPEVGFILSSEITAEIDDLTLQGDFSPVTRPVDYSLGLGAGINFQLGTATVFFESRYATGLTDLTNGGIFQVSAGPLILEGTVDPEDEAITKGFQFYTGITIPLKW